VGANNLDVVVGTDCVKEFFWFAEASFVIQACVTEGGFLNWCLEKAAK